MQEKNVLVVIADGIEELEAVTIIDVLRRANVGVRVSSIEDREVTGANDVKIVADSVFRDEAVEDYDGIILPGGTEGAKCFAAYGPLTDALTNFAKQNNLVAAICASPGMVLAGLGILANKKATGYPSFKQHIPNYVNDPVVVDGNIVTSQGPGTALPFALKLAEILMGKKTADEVKAGMLA